MLAGTEKKKPKAKTAKVYSGNMKRLYLKGLEDGQVSFVEVTIKNSIAKIEIISRSAPGNPWTVRPPKVFDLNNDNKKREYNNFKEKLFDGNRLEFESVKKQMNKR